ncbi:MAG: helix-turn-helix transcriptional regulator [Tepidisphaeraceae bacterium]
MVNPLKQHREAIGVSQREIAEACGRTVAQVWNWEHDRSAPTRIDPTTLAAAYRVPLSVMKRWLGQLASRCLRHRLNQSMTAREGAGAIN